MLQITEQTLKLTWKAVQYPVQSHFRKKNSLIRYSSDSQRAYSTNNNVRPKIQKRDVKETLMKLDLTVPDINLNSELLNSHPDMLEQRELILKEGGFCRISSSVLERYQYLILKKVSSLKSDEYIRYETDVGSSFLRHLGNPSLDTLPVLDDNNRFIKVHRTIILHYLMSRLQTTESAIQKLMKQNPRVNDTSLQLMLQTLGVLENDFGFSKQKIVRNGFLLHIHPHYIMDKLERVHELCGIDIRQVLLKFPVVVSKKIDAIISISNELKEHGIPDSAIQHCFRVFTLSKESVNDRLEKVQTMPELHEFSKHEKVRHLVDLQAKLCYHLSDLRNLQSPSLHALVGSQSTLKRLSEFAEIRIKSNDIIDFLSQELDCQQSKIRNTVSRHSLWDCVHLETIHETLEMLLEEGFSQQDILHNVHILLYHSYAVKKELAIVADREEVKAAQRLQQTLNKVPPLTTSLLPDEKKLALSLYFIEQPFYFTGNGIWNYSI